MMSLTPNAPDSLVQRLRAILNTRDNVREVRMFGVLAFMVDERLAVAAARDGDLLVRTDPARRDEMLARGAVPATMGTDRPMGRRWLTVPAHQLRDRLDLEFWVDVGISAGDAAG